MNREQLLWILSGLFLLYVTFILMENYTSILQLLFSAMVILTITINWAIRLPPKSNSKRRN